MRRLVVIAAVLAIFGTYGVAGRAATRPHVRATAPTVDYNGDGFADIAIAVPFEDIGSITNSGAVNVVYGSATGLTDVNNQFWNQDSTDIQDQVDVNDEFGLALASGDFNGDGFSDLAVGVPLEDIGISADAGGVNVIYGSVNGLDADIVPNQFWNQDSPNILDQVETGDQFGTSLAAGDYNMDGFVDLAIGVPNEDVGTLSDAGAFNLLFGSSAGLTDVGNEFWTQDSPGVLDVAESGDHYANTLASGDVNGNGFPDLVVGAPQEDVTESLDTISDAGAINVLFGSAAGITATGNQFFQQNTVGILAQAEASDQFGKVVAVGNFNGDAFADVAVGVPLEDLNGKSDVGAVNVLYGSASGLSTSGNQLWGQDSPNILDTGDSGDEFGWSLAVGNFDGDAFDDLAAGIPLEDFGTPNISNPGMVAVIYGSVAGLAADRNQFWTQNSSGIQGVAENSDEFGWAVSAGDYNADTFSDLAVGVPFEDVTPATDAGAVQVILGSATGTTAVGNQFWSQDVPPTILDQGENNDNFGYALG